MTKPRCRRNPAKVGQDADRGAPVDQAVGESRVVGLAAVAGVEKLAKVVNMDLVDLVGVGAGREVAGLDLLPNR